MVWGWLNRSVHIAPAIVLLSKLFGDIEENASLGTIEALQRVNVGPIGDSCPGGECTDAPPAHGTSCQWWTPSIGRETDTMCTAAGLRRLMSPDAMNRAIERAQTCAVEYGVTCVLSHEVNFRIPSALLWSQELGKMRMFLLPQFDKTSIDPNTSDGPRTKRVAIVTPPFTERHDSVSRFEVHMNQSIVVEHVDVNTHTPMREVLTNEEAFCLQLLPLTIPNECTDGM